MKFINYTSKIGTPYQNSKGVADSTRVMNHDTMPSTKFVILDELMDVDIFQVLCENIFFV